MPTAPNPTNPLPQILAGVTTGAVLTLLAYLWFGQLVAITVGGVSVIGGSLVVLLRPVLAGWFTRHLTKKLVLGGLAIAGTAVSHGMTWLWGVVGLLFAYMGLRFFSQQQANKTEQPPEADVDADAGVKTKAKPKALPQHSADPEPEQAKATRMKTGRRGFFQLLATSLLVALTQDDNERDEDR